MKAILVIDVPVLDDGRHLCNECPIWNDEHLFCEYDFNTKAKGCPLKPMPMRKVFMVKPDAQGYNPWVQGWNECLEEIEK